ncbi:MAG: PIN domain-containing protein [Acidobacteria bacterium]|nr:PIN domain-containing protein [Acidobacteriota bacterium]
MILPDVNVLIYAYDRQSHYHQAAVKWLERTLTNEEVYLSWHTITGFVRIITHPSVLRHPTSMEKAVDIVGEWLARENVHLVGLEKRNWPLFTSALIEGHATGNLVMDAHLAALAVSCGATLATTDRDFSRFPGLRSVNPLAE